MTVTHMYQQVYLLEHLDILILSMPYISNVLLCLFEVLPPNLNSRISTNHISFLICCRYHATMMPTAKSDVYGFGVVLLELVTGKNPILRTPEPISLIHWVQQRLQCGNIEGVVDTRMHGVYDINSVWKVAEIALKCTAQASTQRPTMTDVVVQLQECLDLEYGHASSVPELSIDHVSKTRTILEMDHLERVPLPTMSSGPSAR